MASTPVTKSPRFPKRTKTTKLEKKKSIYWPSPKTARGHSLTKDVVLELSKGIIKTMVMNESKEIIPQFRGSNTITTLRDAHPGYTLTDTKESALLRQSLSSMFLDKHYEFRCSTALNMSSSASGIVNSNILTSALQFVTDFISLSAVFNEAFIKSMTVIWQPVSRYNYPLTGTASTTVANLPIGVASLQHAQSSYSSLAGMVDNYHLGFYNTGDPFRYEWLNSEKPIDTTVAVSSGACQSWTDVSNMGNYQGNIQFISQSAPPGLPTSQVLGTFAVFWDVLFRLRA